MGISGSDIKGEFKLGTAQTTNTIGLFKKSKYIGEMEAYYKVLKVNLESSAINNPEFEKQYKKLPQTYDKELYIEFIKEFGLYYYK